MTASSGGGKLAFVGAGICAVAAAGLVGVYFSKLQKPRAVAPKSAPAAGDTTALRASVTKAAEKFLTQPVTLTFDGKSTDRTWQDLGLAVDPDAVARAADKLSAPVGEDFYTSGAVGVPVAADPGKTVDALVALKDRYDRSAVDARLDLDHRQVLPDAAGYGVHVYESITALEDGARAALKTVPLAGGEVTPHTTAAQLAGIDISKVMGSFETHFPPYDRDRNYNLKLIASHIDGHILMPGDTFSFNDTTGDRTEKQGYRVAHVINAGEMVDGDAGGACQVSTTLHGASWFAGLDLVSSRPHSRPSAYVTMGLDATVVYPTTDLKLKNPYDFPVAFHYIISQGVMRVEILGKGRPWDKIAFEREIKKTIPYDTVTRDDDNLPVGTSIIDQVGFPGYSLIRRRIFYKDKKVAKTEKWDIDYPPTTEYMRVGTNEDPNIVPPDVPIPHGLTPPGKDTYHFEQ
jgi:vancomycin resistance protein YoaR